ncbi:MAG: hypothetical protein ACQESP_13000 [Candidatus Muiribacteriota bacterium]
MTNYESSKMQETFRNVLIIGMLYGSIGTNTALNSNIQTKSNYSRKSYSINDEVAGSYAPVKNVFTGDYSISSTAEFEREISEFYTKLSSEQEPLGKEFEEALFENLWDMYQS